MASRSKTTVPLSEWRGYVRLAVLWLVARFITSGFTAGTYPGHDPNQDRAVDFMVPEWQTPAGIAKGDKLANYLANVVVARRLGIWYVIWRGRIWSMTRPEKGWLRYFDADNPNPSRSHHNHVHVSFYDKAASDPLYDDHPASDPAGNYPRPKDAVLYLDRIRPGQKDSDSVYWLQRWLREAGYTKAIKTGAYDDATVAAVKDFQAFLHDDPDGSLDAGQIRRLQGLAKTHVKIEAKS